MIYLTSAPGEVSRQSCGDGSGGWRSFRWVTALTVQEVLLKQQKEPNIQGADAHPPIENRSPFLPAPLLKVRSAPPQGPPQGRQHLDQTARPLQNQGAGATPASRDAPKWLTRLTEYQLSALEICRGSAFRAALEAPGRATFSRLSASVPLVDSPAFICPEAAVHDLPGTGCSAGPACHRPAIVAWRIAAYSLFVLRSNILSLSALT